MVVAAFSVTGWVRVLVVILTVGIPRVERLSQLFENCLTGLCVQIRVAFVVLEVRFGNTVVWYRSGFVPDTATRPPDDILEFRGGDPKRIEILAHLLVIADGCKVGVGDLIRHT